MIELGFFVLVQFNLHDAFDAAGTNHGRNTAIKPVNTIFARQMGSARHHALLVFQIRVGHRNGGACRSIESGAGFQKLDDLGTTITGALDDFIKTALLDPAILTRSVSGIPATVE